MNLRRAYTANTCPATARSANLTHAAEATGAQSINFTSNTTGNVTLEISSLITGSGSYGINPYIDLDNVQLSWQQVQTTSVNNCTGVEGYRYGFNNQEKDNEVYGEGNSTTAEFWQYDARLGRRWNVDPLTYPWHSSYSCFNTNPIYFIDPLGLYSDETQAKKAKKRAEKKGYATQEIYQDKKDGEWKFQIRKTSGKRNSLWQSESKEENFGRKFRRNTNWGYARFGKVESVAFEIQNNSSIEKHNTLAWKATNTIVNAFGIASGVKETIIESGAALNRGINITKVNNVSILRTYGATGAKYLKYSKGLGVLGSVVTTSYALSEVIQQGQNGGFNEVISNREIIDASVGLTGLGFAAYGIFVASNPVGWAVGAGVLIYGGITMVWDAANSKD